MNTANSLVQIRERLTNLSEKMENNQPNQPVTLLFRREGTSEPAKMVRLEVKPRWEDCWYVGYIDTETGEEVETFPHLEFMYGYEAPIYLFRNKEKLLKYLPTIRKIIVESYKFYNERESLIDFITEWRAGK